MFALGSHVAIVDLQAAYRRQVEGSTNGPPAVCSQIAYEKLCSATVQLFNLEGLGVMVDGWG